MGRRFRALILHRGDGKQRGDTGRGSVGDVEARGAKATLSTTVAGRMGGAVALEPEEGDDPGGLVLGQKATVAWADFRKFQGKSRRAAMATGPN
jgi:hypothetical protein